MATNETTIRSRIDPALKSKAERVLNSMGLNLSEAIRLFLHQVVAVKALPFLVKAPNAKTLAALEAVERGEVEPVTFDQIREDWLRHEKRRPGK